MTRSNILRAVTKRLAQASATLLLTSIGATAALAQAAPAPMTTPAMAGPLAANPNPYSFDLPDWFGDAGGKVYVTGAVSGIGFWQSGASGSGSGGSSFGNSATGIDLSNAQVFIQKTDGWLQFFVQAGAFSFPTVGTPYVKSEYAPTFFSTGFTDFPVAYLKLQGEGDLADFSLEGGKLPTLIGDEYLFTFENMNIERGLLWNIEPAVSRGLQANYSNGPLNVSFSWNDGFYSTHLNWLSGLASYAFDGGADTVALAAGGTLGNNYGSSALNQGSVYNLIWTHTSGPWTISPYIQIIMTPTAASIGERDTTDIGGAILASYSIDDNWKLAGRVEYSGSSGHGVSGTPYINGYGPGSDAWSITVTPTYQWKAWFARTDFSYVGVSSGTPGSMFGASGNSKDQERVMVETGVLF